jgi:acyl carrier protein
MEAEEVLVKVQEALVAVAPDRITSHDWADAPLSELGISSVEMVSIVFAIEEKLNIVFPDEQLTAEVFFSCKTIALASTELLPEKRGLNTETAEHKLQ